MVSFKMLQILAVLGIFATMCSIVASRNSQLSLTARDSHPSDVPSDVAASVCSRDVAGEILVAQCPDKCMPFSAEVFNSCADKISRGCSLRTCARPSMVRCQFDPKTYDNITACAGDTIVLDKIRFWQLQKLSYNFGLKIPESMATEKADIYFLFDNTMPEKLSSAIAIAQSVLHRYNKDVNVHFGVGVFKGKGSLVFSNLQSITDNIKDVQMHLHNIQLMNRTESYGLASIAQAGFEEPVMWRSGSKRLLIYFGDKPSDEPLNYHTPGFTPLCISRGYVASVLVSSKVALIAVDMGHINAAPRFAGTFSCSQKAKPGQASDISEATGGDVVGHNATQLITAIDTRRKSIVSKHSLGFFTDCDPIVTAEANPTFPVSVTQNSTVRVSRSISVSQSVCTLSRYDCTHYYTLDGDMFTKIVLSIRNVSRCPSTKK